MINFGEPEMRKDALMLSVSMSQWELSRSEQGHFPPLPSTLQAHIIFKGIPWTGNQNTDTDWPKSLMWHGLLNFRGNHGKNKTRNVKSMRSIFVKSISIY